MLSIRNKINKPNSYQLQGQFTTLDANISLHDILFSQDRHEIHPLIPEKNSTFLFTDKQGTVDCIIIYLEFNKRKII